MNDILQVTPDNPLILTTAHQLEDIILRALRRAGYHTNDIPRPDPLPTELPTHLARKYLIQRGYRAGSHASFTHIIHSHGIPATRRGRENWYQVIDLNKLPNRIEPKS